MCDLFKFAIVVLILVAIPIFISIYIGFIKAGEVVNGVFLVIFCLIIITLLGSVAWSIDTARDKKSIKAGIELYFDEKEEIVSKISERNAGDWLVETTDGDYFVVDILENGQVVEKNNVKRKED